MSVNITPAVWQKVKYYVLVIQVEIAGYRNDFAGFINSV
jgi:hypothetical protein